MMMFTKEKSSPKRKCVKNQNNFTKLFPVFNTTFTSSSVLLEISIKNTKKWSKEWGVVYVLPDEMNEYVEHLIK